MERDLRLQPAPTPTAGAEAPDGVLDDATLLPDPQVQDHDDQVESAAPSPFEDPAGGNLLGDSVRMYLREIGRVPLLTAPDERRLASQFASGSHVQQWERDLAGNTGHPPNAAAMVRALLWHLHEQAPVAEALAEYLGIPQEMTLGELSGNAKLRVSIDGPIDPNITEALAQRWAKQNAEIYHDIVRLSLNSQILPAALESLNGRERRVIQLRFGLDDNRPRSLIEIGRDFGAMREPARQIEAKALRTLRHTNRTGGLRAFVE